MTNDPKQQSRKDFEKQIVLKAWKDPAFREELLKDPKGTFQKELHAIDPGFELPANMNVHVVEEDADNLYLVIPQHPVQAIQQTQISDGHLEDAAGGSITVVAVGGVAVVAAAQLAANANTAANANALANANVSTNANATSNVNTMS